MLAYLTRANNNHVIMDVVYVSIRQLFQNMPGLLFMHVHVYTIQHINLSQKTLLIELYSTVTLLFKLSKQF